MNSPHSWGSSACLGAMPHRARHLLPLGCASYSGPASPATKHALSSHEVGYWSRDQMESMQCNGSGPSWVGDGMKLVASGITARQAPARRSKNYLLISPPKQGG